MPKRFRDDRVDDELSDDGNDLDDEVNQESHDVEEAAAVLFSKMRDYCHRVGAPLCDRLDAYTLMKYIEHAQTL